MKSNIYKNKKMTSTSPFQGSTENNTPDNPEKFSIRTMQDDLLSKQSKPVARQEELVAPKITIPQTPLTPTPFSASDISSAKISSSTQPLTMKNDLVEIPSIKTETPDVKTKNSLYNTIIVIIFLLIIGIIGLSAYYFLAMNTKKQELPTPTINEEPVVIEKPAEEVPIVQAPVEKYSKTKPNYLTMDPSVLSEADIKTTIAKVASEIQALTESIPYEFIIVDSNNNPVPFSIFATATKLTLSPEILSYLDDDFSLFIYNDNNNPRTGLSINILPEKNSSLSAELQKQELLLPEALSFFFLDTVPDIKNSAFTATIYNSNNIRYLNVNEPKNLSIDYTVSGSQLAIGTSKNTLRSILDKTIQQKQSLGTNIDNNEAIPTQALGN